MDREAKALLARGSARRAARGPGGDRRHPRPRVRRRLRRRAVLLADGRVIADGTDRRAARRRLVLRHRDRAHPRRRRRGAAAGAGRGAAGRARGRAPPAARRRALRRRGRTRGRRPRARRRPAAAARAAVLGGGHPGGRAVSWPLASFRSSSACSACGWLAYERRRPSARMVAVVAMMAALAALGRDAFVALPDVKPITAMTFVVGYALGPLPASPSARSACSSPTSCSARAPTRRGRWRPGGWSGLAGAGARAAEPRAARPRPAGARVRARALARRRS